MSWQTAVEPVVETIRNDLKVPGIVIALMQDGRSVEYLVSGTDAKGYALTGESLIPVASITKLATALTILRLVAAGALKLDDPLANYLPEAAAAREGVTIRNLLCHTSGLPYDIEPELAPYTSKLDWPTLAQGCMETSLASAPQTQVRYSNLGPGLLAIVTERLTDQSFSEALARHVLHPLHIEGYLGVEPPRRPAVMAGELGEHAGTSIEPYNSAFWRSLALPWGGLLTTAAGVLALVRAFAGLPADFLPHDLVSEATRDQTGGLDGGLFEPFWWPRSPWGLGVEMRGDKTPHWAPAQASSVSFGHLGASGCLVWHDPVADLSWAILGMHTFESWWRHLPTIGATILKALGQ